MLELESKKIESVNEAILCAKSILRTARFGALAVIETDTGHPLNSRVGVTNDIDGSPILLLSQLSLHTKALQHEPRCSLLLGEVGRGDPLNSPRVSLIAVADQISKKSGTQKYLRDRYLRQHPRAKLYIDFSDFSFFRVQVERANLNAGFGQFFALKREDLILSQNWLAGLQQQESEILRKSNESCKRSIKRYVEELGLNTKQAWKIISIDPDGFNLSAGVEIVRVNFSLPLKESDDLVNDTIENIQLRIQQD